MHSPELLSADVDGFISHPFPLWENALTDQLVKAEKSKRSLKDITTYSTAGALLNEFNIIQPVKTSILPEDRRALFLEYPDFDRLGDFYHGHGLIPLTADELQNNEAKTKIFHALKCLKMIPGCLDCVLQLVNCVQVISSDGANYDTSYSHPKIPFTVFVSVCEDISMLSNFRVAEGILHEAMHLKLTLIQQFSDLVKPNSTETFYSPWRDIQRPLMGVIHGAFVFRAVKDFFNMVLEQYSLDNHTSNHLAYRIADIENDFSALKYFANCSDLTKAGQIFVARLLSE